MVDLLRIVQSDPVTRAYQRRKAAVQRAAAPAVEVYDPTDRILAGITADQTAPVSESVVIDAAPRETSFLENLLSSPERLRIGAIQDPSARQAALASIYGAENVLPVADSDNFRIREDDGGFRLYNPEGFDVGDIASIVPEVVGTIASIPAAAAGATLGTSVGPAGTIAGGVAGGGAGYAGGKNAAAQLVSGLFGDINPVTAGDVAMDVVEGGMGELVGPAIRAARPYVGSAVTNIVAPVRSFVERTASSAVPTNSLSDILNNQLYSGISESAVKAAQAAMAGADPRIVDISGRGGQTLLNVAGRLSPKVGEANEALAQQMVDDALAYTQGQGIATGSDALGAFDDLLSRFTANREAVKAARDLPYAGLSRTQEVDVSPIRQSLLDIISRGQDVGSRIRESEGLLKGTTELLSRAARPNTRLPGAATIAARPDASQAVKEQVGLYNTLTSQIDPIESGQITDLVRDFGFVPGLARPAMEEQQLLREATRQAFPELAAADAAAAPYSTIMSSQMATGTGGLTKAGAINQSALKGLYKTIDTGGVPTDAQVRAIGDLVDQGLLQPTEASDLANQILGAMSTKSLGKIKQETLQSLSSIAEGGALPDLMTSGTLVPGRAADAARTAVDDLMAGNLTPEGAERLQRSLLASERVSSADEAMKRFGQPTDSTSSFIAPILGALANPAFVGASMGATRVIPRRISAAMAGTTGRDAVVKAAQRRLARQAASEAAGLQGAIPVIREFLPAYRQALADQNALEAARAADFASRVPAGTYNPFEGALFSSPSMGTLGATTVDDYLKGLRSALPSEAAGRSAVRYLTELGNEQEREETRGAF